MSSYSIGIRVSIFVFVVAAYFAATANGADSNVARASHTQAAKNKPAEIEDSNLDDSKDDDTKNDDMSYSPQWPEPPNTGAMLMRLCIGTVVVLVVCVGSLWFGKPWLQRLQVAGAGNPSFYIEGSVSVGNRAMLYLVRVGGTQLVAGTDASGLKSLVVIPAVFKDVLDEQIPEIEPPTPAVLRPLRPIENVAKPASTIEIASFSHQRPFDGRSVTRSESKE